MAPCDYYFGKIFLHLAGAIGISAASAEYVNIGDSIYSPFPTIVKFIFNLVVIVALLYGVYTTRPRSIQKYLLFAALAFWFGQVLQPYVQYLEDSGKLTNVFLLTLGVFVGMMAIGFYDKDHLLGLGPYLVAAVGGLILAQIILLVVGGPFRIIQFFAVALFSLFTAYDVQVLRRNQANCVNPLRDRRDPAPDYPKESIGLYFDFLNIFQNMRF